MKKNGKSQEIKDPQNATDSLVSGLEGNKKYVFRLLAENKSGRNVGPILGPITTVEHAPDMLDKSGWMTILPKNSGKKTLSRRMSMKKKNIVSRSKSWHNPAAPFCGPSCPRSFSPLLH
jgi:hypothetical protein